MSATSVRELPEQGGAEAEWDAFVAGHPQGGLYHTSVFRRLIREASGHFGPYLEARREGAIVGVLPLVQQKSLIFGNALISLPFFNHAGVLAADAEARDALLAAAVERARWLGASHIELRHLGTATTGEGLDWPEKTTKVEMMLELPATAEALWQGFKPKLRAQVRRPRKAGIYVRLGGLELLDDFYEVFARNMRDLGTPVYAKAFFRTFLTHLAGTARVAVGYLGEGPVAGGIVVGHRDVLEIPWASTVREANVHSPNMLLYWTLLEYAVEHGYRRFDFGRSTAGEGTYDFKRQWGAEPVQLHWHYWLRGGGPLPEVNPHNPKYQLVIKAWQRLPLPVTKLLGPHLVKNLP